ncbi:hypothetical protein F5X99DRAFT_378355 [Biscogniauxia marginata]|nr:hypothetical protein F5X99DRAFT_378355 [Biscogniauxia marginata]
MSSVSGLSRTRSLRRPTVRGDSEASQNEPAPIRNVARKTSPSRLPIKPLTRSASARISASSTGTARTGTTGTIGTATGRPVSGIFSSRKVSNPAENASSTTTTTTTTRALARAPSTRQAPPSTTSSVPTRTNSITRPRSSGGPPSTTATRERQLGHSRAKSTVTNLTTATTLRPVSTLSSSTSTSASTVTTTTTAPTTTTRKPLTRSQTHSRAQSQTHTQSQLPTSPKHTTTTTTASAQQPQQHRPSFNTNQQHFSPAKNLAPKPLMSTFLAPPSPSKLPANVAISAETSRLQTELLQLSLLHRDAAAVDAEWHASARQKLGARFARLVAADADVAKLEREGVEAQNIGALVRWAAGGFGSGKAASLEEKVQLLDQVLSGVWSLGEPAGRYQRAVRGFETWADRAAAILAAQRSGDVDALLEGDDVVFLSELDRGWKRDCAGLTRMLEGWREVLRELGDAGEEPDAVDTGRSGLARVLGGCRSLVHDMLAELAVMEQIEHEATRAEAEWIESMNDELKANDTHQKDDVPLWKLVL